MPGLVGVISPRSADECQHLVKSMVASMNFEDFYGSGICCVPEIGVYGAWVAHEGSMAAHQSAYTNRNGVTLLFSGEYFQPVHAPQESSRSCPMSNGFDPDLLLNLYDQQGDSFVRRLNGLFSGLLIDPKRKRALLFNDRYGIERIYFYEHGDTCYFASEAKGLLRAVPELRAFDDEGVAQFCAVGCTLAGRTLFRNVSLLPGGSNWIFEENKACRKERYFLPEEWESLSPLTENDFENEFLATFERILPRYFSADLPIGISLTGGLDTRMIMAGMPRDIPDPVCYTFCGIRGETLDAKLGARVARACGLEHHVLRIAPDFLANFGEHLDHTVFVTDGYAGALTAHEAYLNAKGRSLSRVRLTGNFGSEILRSMSTFKPINLTQDLFDKGFYPLINSTIKDISLMREHPVTYAAFREIPLSLYGSLAAGRSQLTFRTPYLDNEIVELAFRAPVHSRQSPRSALRLVNTYRPGLAAIPTDRGLVWGGHGAGYLIRRLYSEATFRFDYFHKEGLPHWLSPLDPLIGLLGTVGLLGLHKYLPYRSWFKLELSAYAKEVLSDSTTQRMAYWNSVFLQSILSDHLSGRKNYLREISAILSLEATHRRLVRGSSGYSENM
ncbi:MAG: asparagine synthase-related protein [Gammaproteobacteria bacterium]